MEISLKNIHKSYGTTTVLSDVSFRISKKAKIGLVGLNGIGKSTLFKIIAGELEYDSGVIQCRKGLVVAYMPQDTSIPTSETVLEYLYRVSGIAKLEATIQGSKNALSEYKKRDGFSFNARATDVLLGFGFDEIETNTSIAHLSSGQKSKVFLAGILLSDADVLLLDEPTNNLDLPALLWLEDFLIKSDMAYMVVSHDRRFLDRVVNKIFEIDWQKRTLNITRGSYTDYLERARKEMLKRKNEYVAQREELGRLKVSAEAKRKAGEKGAKYVGTDNDKRIRGYRREKAGSSSRSAKVIENRMAQIKEIEKPIDRKSLHLEIDPNDTGGSKDISLKNVTSGYSETGFFVGPISMDVPFGSRVAIMGLNGTGKTAVLKTITGQLLPLKGEIKIGSGVVVGNLMQEHSNLLRDISIRESIEELTILKENEVFNLSKKYGFQPHQIDKPISTLSPGGRARLLLAIFSATSANVLVLDEPTNHLDIEALDAIEEVVANYNGTIILVSHDRYFLEKFNPTVVYVLSGGKLAIQKSYDDYVLKSEQKARALIDKS